MTTAPAAAKIRSTSFRYFTSVRWAGGRTGELASGGTKPSIRIASPPEFRGEPHVWTPEDLFVAAIDTCLLLTFVSQAERENLRFDSYEGQAEGLLKLDHGGFRFTQVTLRPRIEVEDAAEVEAARRVVARAHETCLVARSVRCEVTVEPEIHVRS